MFFSRLKSRLGKKAYYSVMATGLVATTAVVVPVAIVANQTVSAQNELDAFMREFPGTVEQIGGTFAIKPYAFEADKYGSSKFEMTRDFKIPRKVTKIGAYAFRDAFFYEGFSIPESVVEIDPTAFDGAGSLANYWWNTSKIVPGSKIGLMTESEDYIDFVSKYPASLDNNRVKAHAFHNFIAPQGFNLPPFVREVEESGFEGSILPPGFRLPSAFRYFGERSFAGAVFSEGFAIPRLIESIDWRRIFYGASFAEGFVLPDSVKQVYKGAFANARLPLSFSIPNTTMIVSDIVSKPNFSPPPEKYWTELGGTIIPAGCKWSDPRGAVSGSKVIKGIPEVEHEEFLKAYPNSLSKINGKTAIKSDAFANRTDLPFAFVLPSQTVSIGARAFQNAILRQGFAIPDSVVSIDPTAFEGVTFEEQFYWSKSKPVAGSRVDRIENNEEYLSMNWRYPGSISFYGSEVVFIGIREQVPEDLTIPQFITMIGYEALAYQKLPQGFKLPQGVYRLRDRAFLRSTFPSGFKLPVSLKKIGTVDRHDENRIFSEAVFADDFTLSSTVDEIFEDAFLDAQVPLGFSIPATTKIYKHDWSRPSGEEFYTSPDFELLSVKIPPGSKWDSPSGKAVSGAGVVPA